MQLFDVRTGSAVEFDSEVVVTTTDGRTLPVGALVPADLVRWEHQQLAVDEASWRRAWRSGQTSADSRRYHAGVYTPVSPPVTLRKTVQRGTARVYTAHVEFPRGTSVGVREAVLAQVEAREDEGEQFAYAARAVLASAGFSVVVTL